MPDRRLTLVGPKRLTIVGPIELTLVGPTELTLVGPIELTLVGPTELTLVGPTELTLVGPIELTLVGPTRLTIVKQTNDRRSDLADAGWSKLAYAGRCERVRRALRFTPRSVTAASMDDRFADESTRATDCCW